MFGTRLSWGKLKHLQMKANCGIFETTGSNFVLFNVVSVQATGEPLVRSHGQLWIFGDLAFCSTNVLDTENATACSANPNSSQVKEKLTPRLTDNLSPSQDHVTIALSHSLLRP